MKKLLIVGANGQVGTSFLQHFTGRPPQGYDVWFTVRAGAVEHGSASRMLSCDLTSPDQIATVMRTIKPEVVINCAAYTAVDKAETERDLAQKVNGVAPGIIADEAKKLGAWLVHYSTDYVFNGSGTTPWCEDDATDPVNFYGETKLAGENAVRDVGGEHLILRTQWVYAAHGHNFVKTMLRFGAERPQLKVVGDQIGAPTSADVIRSATLDLLTTVAADRADTGIYNLACSGFTSWHAFAEQIFNEARSLNLPLAVKEVLNIPSSEFPTPAKRPHNSRLNLAKIEAAIGRSMPSWTSALTPVMQALVEGAKK